MSVVSVADGQLSLAVVVMGLAAAAAVFLVVGMIATLSSTRATPE